MPTVANCGTSSKLAKVFNWGSNSCPPVYTRPRLPQPCLVYTVAVIAYRRQPCAWPLQPPLTAMCSLFLPCVLSHEWATSTANLAICSLGAYCANQSTPFLVTPRLTCNVAERPPKTPAMCDSVVRRHIFDRVAEVKVTPSSKWHRHFCSAPAWPKLLFHLN
jgi:hypothetical protein